MRHGVAALVALSLAAGCRPAEQPQFTPSAQVVALIDDIDDPEELKLYKSLQTQIAATLTARAGTAGAPKLLGDDGADAERLRRGFEIYTHYCVQCHGVNGDGQGVVARHLSPRPRDYTQGIFKFSSTSNGKARKADLVRTVRRGVSGTSMPSFATFSNQDLSDVVDYVLALTHRGELQQNLAQIAYDDGELPDDEGLDALVEEILAPWREANGLVVMPAGPMPPMTEETIAHGREMFLKFACSRCHGNDGRGGSLGNVEVGTDVWGRKAAAADLTSGMFRGGARPIDLYRRISAGITGTPMPAFAGQFENDPDSIWHLVHFIKETGQRRRRRLPPEAATPTAPPAAPAESTPAESAPAETAPADSAPAEPEAPPAAEPAAEPEAPAPAEEPAAAAA